MSSFLKLVRFQLTLHIHKSLAGAFVFFQNVERIKDLPETTMLFIDQSWWYTPQTKRKPFWKHLKNTGI